MQSNVVMVVFPDVVRQVVMVMGVPQHVGIAVLVGNNMFMDMLMMDNHGVPGYESGADSHHGERRIEQRARPIVQYEQGEEGTEEWRDSIIGAGFRRADAPLRRNVDENTQAVRHEPE